MNYQFAISVDWKSPVRDVHTTAIALTHWDFFFVASAFIGLFSLYFLSSVQEIGDNEDVRLGRVFITSIRHGLQDMSNFGGTRSVVELGVDWSDVRKRKQLKTAPKSERLEPID